MADIKRITPRELNQLDERITLNYARVSSHDQKEDLKRQAQVLEAFSAANGWQYETIQDLGSGLNYHKKGLQKLLKRIMQGDVPRLVLTHKDRLLRFGAELVFAVCEEFETEVVILNKSSQEISFERSQYALRQLSEAWKQAFKKIKQPPRFKKKGRAESFTVDGSLAVDHFRVKVPVIGWINTTSL